MKATIEITAAFEGDGWDLAIDGFPFGVDVPRKMALAMIEGFINRELDKSEEAAVHPPDEKIPW